MAIDRASTKPEGSMKRHGRSMSAKVPGVMTYASASVSDGRYKFYLDTFIQYRQMAVCEALFG